MKSKSLYFFFAIILISIFACEFNTSQNQKTEAESSALDETTKSTYLAKGKSIASQTFSTLSANLQSALAEGGVPAAIEYCNLAAMPLVDSLSKVHNATIRRTSFKTRNPEDKPSQIEEKTLQQYEINAKNGDALKPIVQQHEDNSIYFFAPIKINAFCLQCHGNVGETLTEENFQVIKRHYPHDEAIGYKEGDLRGMWSIQFKGE